MAVPLITSCFINYTIFLIFLGSGTGVVNTWHLSLFHSDGVSGWWVTAQMWSLKSQHTAANGAALALGWHLFASLPQSPSLSGITHPRWLKVFPNSPPLSVAYLGSPHTVLHATALAWLIALLSLQLGFFALITPLHFPKFCKDQRKSPLLPSALP